MSKNKVLFGLYLVVFVFFGLHTIAEIFGFPSSLIFHRGSLLLICLDAISTLYCAWRTFFHYKILRSN